MQRTPRFHRQNVSSEPPLAAAPARRPAPATPSAPSGMRTFKQTVTRGRVQRCMRRAKRERDFSFVSSFYIRRHVANIYEHSLATDVFSIDGGEGVKTNDVKSSYYIHAPESLFSDAPLLSCLTRQKRAFVQVVQVVQVEQLNKLNSTTGLCYNNNKKWVCSFLYYICLRWLHTLAVGYTCSRASRG
jgi:hypothetical protein